MRRPSTGLTVPTSYTVIAGGPDDRAPRLDGQARHGQAGRRALAGHDPAQPLGHGADRLGVVPGDVGDAEAAAEVELGQREAVLVADRRHQPDDSVRGDLEPGGVEDLRADVGVQPGQLERRLAQDPAGGLGGVAARQREAELLVLVRGGDELVGVRLDAHRGAEVDALPHPALRREGREPLDLHERVDDDGAHAGVEGGRELGGRTCCCRAAAAAAPGTPARSATASSPPVHTSMPRPSSTTHRATAVDRKALAA